MRQLALGILALGFAGPAFAASSFPPFVASTFPGQLFWLLITFGAVYLLMSRVALPRVASVLDERRTAIDSALKAADDAQKAAEASATELEQNLAKAKANAQAIAQEARAASTKAMDAERHSVEADLAAKLAAAEARISETKAKAMGHVNEIATDAASAIVEQLLGKAPTAAAVQKAVAAAGK